MARFFITVLLFCIANQLLTAQKDCDKLVFEQDGKKGLKQSNGDVILQASFYSIWPFKGERAVVIKDMKYGLIDCEGNILIEPEYDKVDNYGKDFVKITLDKKLGIADKNGKIILPTEYDLMMPFGTGDFRAYPFNQTNKVIVIKDDKRGLFDSSGKQILPLEYDEIGKYSNGLALVKRDRMWGIIDYEGKYLADHIYDSYAYCIPDMGEKGMIVLKKDDLWGILDYDLRTIVPFEYDGISMTYGQDDILYINTNNKIGLINDRGEIIIEPKYNEIKPFVNNRARVRIGTGYGYISKDGKELLPPIYSKLPDETNSYTKPWNGIIEQNGKFGLANTADGTIILPAEYDDIWQFLNGLAPINKDGKWGYINQKGEFVVPLKYDQARLTEYEPTMVSKDGKWGYINNEGKEIVPCIYDDANSFSKDFVAVKRQDKWGILNRTGKEIIPCEYDLVAVLKDGFFKVKTGNSVTFLNKDGEESLPSYVTRYEPGEYISTGSFSEGLATFFRCEYRIRQYEDEYVNCTYGYIDESENEVIILPTELTNEDSPSFRFSHGLAMVYDAFSDRYGYINKKGELFIACEYYKAGAFSEGLAFVAGLEPTTRKIDDSQESEESFSEFNWDPLELFDIMPGYINSKGKMVITLPEEYRNNYGNCYYHGEEFSNGKAVMNMRETGSDCDRYDSITISKKGSILNE